MGVTGTGKSATANSLVEGKYFKESDAAESETNEVKGVLNYWFG